MEQAGRYTERVRSSSSSSSSSSSILSHMEYKEQERERDDLVTQNPDVCLIFSFSFIARREGVAVPVAGLASISRERASNMYKWKEAKTTRSLDTNFQSRCC